MTNGPRELPCQNAQEGVNGHQSSRSANLDLPPNVRWRPSAKGQGSGSDQSGRVRHRVRIAPPWMSRQRAVEQINSGVGRYHQARPSGTNVRVQDRQGLSSEPFADEGWRPDRPPSNAARPVLAKGPCPVGIGIFAQPPSPAARFFESAAITRRRRRIRVLVGVSALMNPVFPRGCSPGT